MVITSLPLKIIRLTIALSVFVSFVCGDFAYAKMSGVEGVERHIPKDLAVPVEADLKKGSPLLVNILDIHGDGGVQRKIADIIKFYDEGKDVKKIFVEGGTDGKIEDGIFYKFDEETRQTVIENMLENAKLPAGQYYALAAGRDILYGIENRHIYGLNLKLIPEMLSAGEKYASFFKEILEITEKIKKIRIKKDILAVFNAIEKYDRVSYKTITGYFEKDLSYDRSEYADFLELQRIISITDYLALGKSAEFFEYLKKNASYGDYIHAVNLASGAPETDNLAALYLFISQKFPETEKMFPSIACFLKTRFLLSKADVYKAELQRNLLKNYLLGTLPHNERELLLLEKSIAEAASVYSLNIKREDFEDFLLKKEKNLETASKYFPEKYFNTLKLLYNDRMPEVVYSNNLKRDSIFFENIEKQIRAGEKNEIPGRKGVYIVITGGFHSELARMIKDAGFSYAVIMPKTAKLTERGSYLKNLSAFYKRNSFAAPAVSFLNGAEPELKKVFYKNIISSWLNAEIASGKKRKDIIEKILKWCRLNIKEDINVPELLENAESIKKPPKPRKTVAQYLKEISKKISFKRTWFNLPELYADLNDIKSESGLKKACRALLAKGVDGFSLQAEEGTEGLYAVFGADFRLPLEQAVNLINDTGYKSNVIFKCSGNISGKLPETLKNAHQNISFVSANLDFIKNNIDFGADRFVFDFGNKALEPENVVDVMGELAFYGIVSVYAGSKVFESFGAYLLSFKAAGKLNIFVESGEAVYNSFIAETENNVIVVSKNAEVDIAGKKNAVAADKNIKAVPFMLLVGGLELFTAFSTIFLQNQGYSLSFISMIFAVCGPFYILGSAASSLAGKYLNKRSIIIINLVLHCIGDALLLFSGVSPVFVVLALGVPSFAAAGVSTLLVPYLQSSLNKINKTEFFDKVYGKTRSIFWLCLAISAVSGSFIAGIIGQVPVIALSGFIISIFTFHIIKTTKPFAGGKETKGGSYVNKTFSKLAERGKIMEGIKTVFKTKGLNSIVILNMFVDNAMFGVLSVGIQTMLINSGIGISFLGAVIFAANLIQSLASKIAPKAARMVSSPARRVLYFSGLLALSAGIIMFNNPVIVISVFLLANLWQGISSVIEPSYIAKHLPEDISAYWFSFKIISTTAISTVFQLAIAALLQMFGVNYLLTGSIAAVLAVSMILGLLFKDNKTERLNLEGFKVNSEDTKMLLSAA
ncbi:MAG: hypothetical protein LBR69_02645 [Endomicrobium sp.]|nr:hypothetical protein [Endomicrobium sp.]